MSKASSSHEGMGALSIPSFTPFPTDCLPDQTARYIRLAAKSIGCDESLIALPLLSALASAIGNTRVIELKPGWREPCIIWTAIIGDSGTHKTPALDRALWAVNKQQKHELDRHQEAMQVHETQMQEHEDRRKQYKRSKNNECPVKPQQPVMKRLLCQDITVEALAMVLADNQRGILVFRDELSGWMSSFDAYKKQGGSSDAAQWLQMYNGKPLMVDRKTGDHKTLYIPHASVSITGGIQPGELTRCLGQKHFENGLAARLLMCMPPRAPCHWTDSSIPANEQVIMNCVFENLWELDVFSEDEPVVCHFDSSGKQAFIKFHNVLSEELAKLTGNLAAAWSKYRGYLARLALLLQHVREAEYGSLNPINGIVIDSESVNAAVRLIRWFGNETKRVYHELEHAVTEEQVQAVKELASELGGIITTREVMRQGPCIKQKAKVMRIFNQLELAGHGQVISSHPSVNGGRPSIIFRLGVDQHGYYGDGEVA